MTTSPPTPAATPRDLEADVLVLGGGPAGAWAALAAAEAGARVVLADKGYLGTSGATAPSNTGTWCVPPGEDRARGRGAALDPHRRRRRPHLDAAHRGPVLPGLMRLAEWGYPFPSNARRLALRRQPARPRLHALPARPRPAARASRVLDHHPALELLSDGDAVTGAAGIDRPHRRALAGRAPAARVLATGGCAFFERTSGAACLTGDGLLMAAEAGASLSGMEFTGKYTLAPYGSSLNKGLPFRWASLPPRGRHALARPRGRARSSTASAAAPRRTSSARCSPGRSTPGSTSPTRAAGLAAAGPAQRHAALRPARHRPLHATSSASS